MFKIQVRKELIDHCSLQVEQYNFGQEEIIMDFSQKSKKRLDKFLGLNIL